MGPLVPARGILRAVWAEGAQTPSERNWRRFFAPSMRLPAAFDALFGQGKPHGEGGET